MPLLLYACIALAAIGSGQALGSLSNNNAHIVSAVSLPKQSIQPKTIQIPVVATIATDKSLRLQQLLQDWADSHSSQQWSTAIQGLGGDNTSAALLSNRKFNTASIYKLYLAYGVFKKYSLQNLDTVVLHPEGRDTTSLKACVELMLQVSDNSCGEAVGELMGWGRGNNALKQIGMTSTDLNSLTTTAADAALFLQKMYDGGLFDTPAQQFVLDLMKSQRYRAGIPTGCPSCTVADKVGDLPLTRHDAAIVQYPGGAYVLTIFTNGASYGQIADLASQIQSVMSGS